MPVPPIQQQPSTGPPIMKPGQMPLPGTGAPQGVPPGPRPPGPAPPQQGGQQPQPKQNRVTSLSKPAGIDPLIILQERENR